MRKNIHSIKVGALIENIIKGNLYFCFCLLFLVSAKFSFAAEDKINQRTRIFTQEIGADSVVLKMDNTFAIPVTVKLDLDIVNLTGKSTFSKIVPANVYGFVLAKYQKIDITRPFKCSYKWKIVLGDASKIPDPTYNYGYPYQKGNIFKISQGPGGEFSHKDMFAYDFLMPVGTPVIASRDGIVAVIKADSEAGGSHKRFIDDANYISVYHIDGTIANYIHLNKNGAIVKEGQLIKKGELIGYSGNTGFSSGPHLHFEIVQPALDFDKSKWLSFNWDIKTNHGLLSYFYRRSSPSL